MAERAYFLDSTEDDEHIYQAADFARFHHQIIGNGISNDEKLPNLKVSATTNMQVALGAGFCFANGNMYENEKTMSLKHDIADSNNDRIDRIIIKFDTNPEKRDFYAYIKKGIAGANPSPPPVERSTYVHEMSVAQVRIKAGSSIISDSQITDERTNDAVCGYNMLHNIYRGIEVDELGMVHLKNQSFIKTRSNNSIVIPANRPLGEAEPMKLGTTEEDTQREIFNSEQLKVKGNGIYYFWVEIGFDNSTLVVGSEIQVYLFVNGKQSFPLGTKLFSDPKDNYMVVSGVDRLNADDIVEFRIATYQFPQDVQTTLTRVRVAKLS